MARGKPSKWPVIESHLTEIKEWSASGATAHDIATALEISDSTFAKYAKEKIELSEALASGRARVILDCKNKLYKLCMGYDVWEEKTTTKETEDGTVTETITYKRHIPASVTAIAMMLRNIDDSFRDRDFETMGQSKKALEIKEKIARSEHFGFDDAKEKTK